MAFTHFRALRLQVLWPSFVLPVVNSLCADHVDPLNSRYSTTRYRIASFSPPPSVARFSLETEPLTEAHLGRKELRAAPLRHAGRRECHSATSLRRSSTTFSASVCKPSKRHTFYSRHSSGFIAPRPPGASTFACIAGSCARRAHSCTIPSSCTPSSTLLARGSFDERGK